MNSPYSFCLACAALTYQGSNASLLNRFPLFINYNITGNVTHWDLTNSEAKRGYCLTVYRSRYSCAERTSLGIDSSDSALIFGGHDVLAIDRLALRLCV